MSLTTEPLHAEQLCGYQLVYVAEHHSRITSYWWHAWDPFGGYAGTANSPQLIHQLIDHHARSHHEGE